MSPTGEEMDSAPTPWKMILDQLSRIETNMLTRAEFGAHQQRIDDSLKEQRGRIDEVQTRALTSTAEWRAESIAEHKELEAMIVTVESKLSTRLDTNADAVKAVREDRAEDEKEKRKDRSTRWFAVALAGVSVLFGLFRDVLLGGVG